MSAVLVGLLAVFVASRSVNALDLGNRWLDLLVWLGIALGFIGVATVLLVRRTATHPRRRPPVGGGPPMTASFVRRVAAVALIATATACSSSWRNDNSAPVEITAAPDGTSHLTLWVSNQSYVDKNVSLTVTLDGVVIIDRKFHVGDQHNHIEHRIRLDDGTHTISATTVIDDLNVELSEEFSIEPNQQRYAGLSYWHYVPTREGDTSFDPPGFNFDIQDEPIGFD